MIAPSKPARYKWANSTVASPRCSPTQTYQFPRLTSVPPRRARGPTEGKMEVVRVR